MDPANHIIVKFHSILQSLLDCPPECKQVFGQSQIYSAEPSFLSRTDNSSSFWTLLVI